MQNAFLIFNNSVCQIPLMNLVLLRIIFPVSILNSVCSNWTLLVTHVLVYIVILIYPDTKIQMIQLNSVLIDIFITILFCIHSEELKVVLTYLGRAGLWDHTCFILRSSKYGCYKTFMVVSMHLLYWTWIEGKRSVIFSMAVP